MTARSLAIRSLLASSASLASCQPAPLTDVSEASSSSDDGDTGTSLPMTTMTTDPPTTMDADTSPGSTTAPETTSSTTGPVDSSGTDDTTGDSTGDPPGACAEGDTCSVDLLFVVDNSGTMGEEQGFVSQGMALLESQLRGLDLDVQVMFTTTDFGNPLCTPFEPAGYDPAKGAPIATACTDRLADFDNLSGTLSIPEACTDRCPNGVAPDDDPFIAFNGAQDNVPAVPDTDVDGDGIADGPVAQSMACLAPMGINGCGYESPLENMLQALNPSAAWNGAPRPFLRDDADILAIAIITDEADCSVKDYSIMEDPTYQEINPDLGSTAASSAICWNAGVTCVGPDSNGVYASCQSVTTEELQPVSRYTNYLVEDIRDSQGKAVVMLGVLGVPSVTEHDADVPYTPTAGGVFDLVYRNWVDGQYPMGDILPAEWAAGETAADKQFDFGIGPGCTGQDTLGNFTGQAIPPVRVLEVCQALDLDDTLAGTRCCIESVCDGDYTPAMRCLSGLVENVAGR